jgi:hypothetical protein
VTTQAVDALFAVIRNLTHEPTPDQQQAVPLDRHRLLGDWFQDQTRTGFFAHA